MCLFIYMVQTVRTFTMSNLRFIPNTNHHNLNNQTQLVAFDIRVTSYRWQLNLLHLLCLRFLAHFYSNTEPNRPSKWKWKKLRCIFYGPSTQTHAYIVNLPQCKRVTIVDLLPNWLYHRVFPYGTPNLENISKARKRICFLPRMKQKKNKRHVVVTISKPSQAEQQKQIVFGKPEWTVDGTHTHTRTET